jgi:peptidyl-prolyl cis-trans isomerase SurA
MNILFPLIFFVLSLFVPLHASSEVVDRIIAIVNDDIITLKEVEKYVQVEKQGSRFVSVNEYFRNIQLREKIDSFIDDLLLKQQAKKLKIDVSDKEVEAVIESIQKRNLITNTELIEQLKKNNIDYKDFFEGIRMNQLRGRVLTRVISSEILITENQIKEYYNAHKDEFRDEEYHVQQIFISGKHKDAPQIALTAYDLLRQGEPFEAVAKEFSDDPSASAGGDIGFVKKGDLFPELQQALSAITPGMYTQVVRTGYGFHILKLLEIKKGESASYEMVKNKIQERIVFEESEKRYKEYIEKIRKSSYIEVKI